MTKYDTLSVLYKHVLKPVYFKFDPEVVHDLHSTFGEFLGNHTLTKNLVNKTLAYKSVSLGQEVSGIYFPNPIGLSAGFDYDGHMAGILSDVGFGFNTVGTVTAEYYEGNEKPRMLRLPKSKSLLVNKGFKSSGAANVAGRLDKMNFSDNVLGISVGSSNIPEVNTVNKAIEDYIKTFNVFKDKEYVKYFELNISCPNTSMTESFTSLINFKALLTEITTLGIRKPIFVKMPNEIVLENCFSLVDEAIRLGIHNFIFSNLVKDRSNKYFDQNEIKSLQNKKGNFSGRPTEENSLKLLYENKKRYKDEIILIGCGGVFNANDVIKKIRMGANLVQLITGMIFEGPQLIGNMNYEIHEYLKRENLENISQLVGVDAK